MKLKIYTWRTIRRKLKDHRCPKCKFYFVELMKDFCGKVVIGGYKREDDNCKGYVLEGSGFVFCEEWCREVKE